MDKHREEDATASAAGAESSEEETGSPKTRRSGSRINRVEPVWSRRRFLHEVGVSSGLAAGVALLGYVGYSRQAVREKSPEIHTLRDFRVTADPHHPLLAVVRGQQVEAMVREAVQVLGGMQRFIQRGDTVLLKPNVGWDRQPEQAANTNPQVVAAVARLCREAGAKAVWVTDCSINDPRRSFTRSGIEAAAQEAGAEVRFPGSNDFLMTDMKGSVLKVWPVLRYFQQANKVINLPVVKQHSLSGCTLAMKNWYGVLGGQRNRLHQNIHPSIVDLAAAVRPTLTVVDATRILLRNGPSGGSLDDVKVENTILAGLDEVALDSWSLALLGLGASQVPYLAMAEQHGLGKVDWRSLNWMERQVG
ncbi:MAG: DUF362 domain-containing protein [Magnetococcales bacterium]|nr:DUF362 domain-containing protein [Magnetococcales bacterium]MBF0113445.1 DUF362 domain-containing protein [Magnetococcales bacterium]